MADKKQGKTFDAFNPPKDVTDPQNLGANPLFPAAIYKFGALRGLPTLTVGWTMDGDEIVNTIRQVADEAALREALDGGWSTQPVLKLPPPKKEKAA